MGGAMTVTTDARIAIVLKKLGEAQNRLYEATKIYEHMLEDRSMPIDFRGNAANVKRDNTGGYIKVDAECIE